MRERGSGTTTRAMGWQPQGGMYVFYGHPSYYMDLVRRIERTDLMLVSCISFADHGWHRFFGRRLSGIYIDHAVYECLNDCDWCRVFEGVERLRPLIR